ncbi:MerR family transcriptional regulator [Salipiger pacificus]|nr:MerR family transcriptional regulator [Alloyangia pacifica]MCA0946016.1 MerR family transcriptional regulator [Alloyangia pacifica]
MSKSRDAFRTISEVAELLDTPAHVLRFWETKFSQVKPVKRAGGRRYYRPNDVALLAGIRQLLHDDGLTIKGVQKVLREQGVKHVASIAPPAELLDEVSEAEPSSIETAPAPEPQESATVLPFTQGGPLLQSETPELADAPEEAAEQPPASVEAAEEAEEAPSHADTTPLFPEIDDPEPHAADQGALWAEDPKAASTAEPAPEATELPGFITESLEARAADTPPPAIPELPDLSALPRPEPGALARLAGLTRIDAETAAELAPHVVALRALMAARRGARVT